MDKHNSSKLMMMLDLKICIGFHVIGAFWMCPQARSTMNTTADRLSIECAFSAAISIFKPYKQFERDPYMDYMSQ